jgi:hypothetical protein
VAFSQLGQHWTVLEPVREQLVAQRFQHVELLRLGPITIAQARNVRTMDPGT